MIATYDKTSVSPTTGSSDSCIVYKRITPRPQLSRCDVISECPECPLDTAFKYPVDVTDTLYFQFHIADSRNADPQNPTFGWFDGLSPNYFVSAYLEFADGTTQLLSGGVDLEGSVLSSNVGWYNGAYQNLVLSASVIREWMIDNGKDDCFRLMIQYCIQEPATFIRVQYIKASMPDPQFYEEGDLIVNSGAIFELISGAFVFQYNLAVNDVVLLETTGQYYEWNGATLDKIARPVGDVNCENFCYSTWHKFINCQDTVLLNGVFGVEDCQGNYYGVSSTDSANGILPYQDKYRLEASLEIVRIFEEKETNENDIVTSFTQKEEWLLRNIASLPIEVIRRLSNTLIATRLYIDSNEFKNPSDRAKLNDEGLYWFTSVSLERDLCEKTNDCDENFYFNPVINCPECVECCESFLLRIYVDGVLSDTQTLEACPSETINIVWV